MAIKGNSLLVNGTIHSVFMFYFSFSFLACISFSYTNILFIILLYAIFFLLLCILPFFFHEKVFHLLLYASHILYIEKMPNTFDMNLRSIDLYLKVAQLSQH